jgi:DNA-directed RNA polymerase specialized sigma24 family protein
MWNIVYIVSSFSRVHVSSLADEKIHLGFGKYDKIISTVDLDNNGNDEMQELYERYKGLLFTLAYQLTGSATDAEDVVQDVFLKVHDVDLARLVEPKAYLCKMVTNRCWDLLKSARKRREPSQSYSYGPTL